MQTSLMKPACEISVPQRLLDALMEIGPLPQEVLFVGICDVDNLPVLHSFTNNNGKPWLVSAPSGWGKTHLLRMVFCASKAIRGREIASLVLTDRPDEWSDLRNLVTVQKINDQSVSIAIEATLNLARHAHGHEYILLLVDGWQALNMDQRYEFAQLENSRIFTMITSTSEVDIDFTRFWQGDRPGYFITLEKDQTVQVQFYAPSL